MEGNQEGSHIVLVIASTLVLIDDIGLRPKIGTKPFHVSFQLLVSNGFVWEEAQRLMRTHGPTHLFVNIGLDLLGTPIAMVAPDEARDRDVAQEAGHDDLLALTSLFGVRGTLQQMRGRREPAFEIVD